MSYAWRSMLFVPAIDEARIAKAHTRGADAIILDLEDGVAASQKAVARGQVGAGVATLRAEGQDVVVRINGPWRLAVADLDAAVIGGVSALIAPKVEDAARLQVLSEMIGELEVERGLPVGGVKLIALIETPAALPKLAEIAAAPRLTALAFGPEDFSVAAGMAPLPANLDLPCRLVALAAAARGIGALGAPVSLSEFKDLAVYGAGAKAGKDMGMGGSLCIHPAQVAVLNETWMVPEAEAAAARRIVEAWDAAPEGAGVISLDGKMIDLPVVLQARRTLDRAALR
jgi:citrate lyase subunit beta/citryl-CoA lyase